MDEQLPLPGIEPDAWVTTPAWASNGGKVHRIWVEGQEFTACGLRVIRGNLLPGVPLSRITCRKCSGLPNERSVIITMRVPRTMGPVEIAQAADMIREFGTIPDSLRENVANAIADALLAATQKRRTMAQDASAFLDAVIGDSLLYRQGRE